MPLRTFYQSSSSHAYATGSCWANTHSASSISRLPTSAYVKVLCEGGTRDEAVARWPQWLRPTVAHFRHGELDGTLFVSLCIDLLLVHHLRHHVRTLNLQQRLPAPVHVHSSPCFCGRGHVRKPAIPRKPPTCSHLESLGVVEMQCLPADGRPDVWESASTNQSGS
jgi:hypothetical protein